MAAISSLYDEAKSLATGDVVDRIAGGLGENPQATAKALTGDAIPAVLGGLVQRFSTGAGPARLMDIIKQNDPDGHLLDKLQTTSAGGVSSLQTSGQGLVSSLFGPRSDAVADVVAGDAGIRKTSANSLLSVAAAMIVGVLGKRVMSGGLDAGGLGALLTNARGDLGRIAPPGLASAMGVQSFGDTAAGIHETASTARDAAFRDTATIRDTTVRRETGGAPRWIPWVIAAAVLLAAIGLLMRTCKTAAPTVTAPAATMPTTTAPTVAPTVPVPARPPTVTMQLPNGVTLNIPQNSLAQGLAVYLGNSSAPPPPRRFTFQDLHFPTAGSTLSADAGTTMNDVAAILRAYPNARVRVEGYTDNVGDPQANMTLSQQRADAVDQALVGRGIAQDRITAQGFGEQNPMASNDTEAGRAQNRHTDLVVTGR